MTLWYFAIFMATIGENLILSLWDYIASRRAKRLNKAKPPVYYSMDPYDHD